MIIYRLFGDRAHVRVKTSMVAAGSLLLLLALSACGGGDPEDVSFELSIVDGGLAGDVSTFVATQDDTVTINLTSDVHGEVHVHGYELKQSVGPDEPASIVFTADATGRYAMEMHPIGTAADEHEHDEGGGVTCDTDITGMAIRLAVEPGEHEGHYVASVEADNFEFSLASGSHWHLTSDGESIGMFYQSSAEIELGVGAHEVVAQLTTSEHCELPVNDSVMVGDGDAMMNGDAMMDDHDHDDGDAMADGDAMTDEHEHDEGEEEFSIGAIEIRPR